jgi:hypothetical protein
VKLKSIVTSATLAAAALAAPAAHAYPIDPAKVPVALPQDPDAARDFTLALDTDNPKIVYYAPKTGRTATLNGQPLIGYAVLPNGEGYLNAQFEFGVFGADKQRLLNAIKNAGKIPVVFPYKRTKVVPLTPGIDPATGQEICETVEDESTGETYEECSGVLYKQLIYSQKGPSLGEFVAVTAHLKPFGAAVYEQFLHSGNALQMALEAEYYAAGTAFEATVTVKYDKLFENWHSYASFHGFLCTDIQVETFFKNETTCLGRDPSECGVWITYKDLTTNEVTTTATIDPDNAAQHEAVFQAAERLAARLRDEMLAPIQQVTSPVDKSRPVGFKLDSRYERQRKGMNASFSFKSPRGVNTRDTMVPISIGCLTIDEDGDVTKRMEGECPLYWQ